MNYFDTFLLLQLFMAQSPDEYVGNDSVKLQHIINGKVNWNSNLDTLQAEELIDEDHIVTAKGRALAVSKLEADYANKYSNINIDTLLKNSSVAFKRVLKRKLDTNLKPIKVNLPFKKLVTNGS